MSCRPCGQSKTSALARAKELLYQHMEECEICEKAVVPEAGCTIGQSLLRQILDLETVVQ